ncbi:hypothetical protein WNY61_09325 [Sulfitobacter sp. AS92]|uniref:hypothetical protein n=1 Tax=Sulfitobacter sp. AS92 TaxID=3135783 RepID=UPI00317285A9
MSELPNPNNQFRATLDYDLSLTNLNAIFGGMWDALQPYRDVVVEADNAINALNARTLQVIGDSITPELDQLRAATAEAQEAVDDLIGNNFAQDLAGKLAKDQNLDDLPDKGAALAALGLKAVATKDFATQEEGEAGENADKPMSPLRTAQAIDALGYQPGAGESMKSFGVPTGSWVEADKSAYLKSAYPDAWAVFDWNKYRAGYIEDDGLAFEPIGQAVLGITAKRDLSRVYLLYNYSPARWYQYDLSTPGDWSTAVQAGYKSLYGPNIIGIINNAGTQFLEISFGYLRIFPLSTPYDVTSAGPEITEVIRPFGETNPNALAAYLKPDGSSLFIAYTAVSVNGVDEQMLVEHALSTPDDFTTANPFATKSLVLYDNLFGLEETNSKFSDHLCFSPDGRRIIGLVAGGGGYNLEITLEEPWNIESFHPVLSLDERYLSTASSFYVPREGLVADAEYKNFIYTHSSNPYHIRTGTRILPFDPDTEFSVPDVATIPKTYVNLG